MFRDLKKLIVPMSLAAGLFANLEMARAATVVRFPILLNENGKIIQVKDLSRDLKKAQIELPESIEVNFLMDPEELIPQLNSSIDQLSRLRNTKMELVKETEVGTFLAKNLKNRLCYFGDRNLALRLLPHLSNSFFSKGTSWVGYRVNGQTEFMQFAADAKADLSRFNSGASVKKILAGQAVALKNSDIQLITEATQAGSASSDAKIEIDLVSICE